MQNITKEEIIEIVRAAVTHQPNMPVQMNNENSGGGGDNGNFLSSAKNIVITVLGAAIIGIVSIQYARNDTSLRFEVKMETQYSSLVEKLDNVLSKYDEVQKELHDRTQDRITKSGFKEEISSRDSKIKSLQETQETIKSQLNELKYQIRTK